MCTCRYTTFSAVGLRRLLNTSLPPCEMSITAVSFRFWLGRRNFLALLCTMRTGVNATPPPGLRRAEVIRGILSCTPHPCRTRPAPILSPALSSQASEEANTAVGIDLGFRPQTHHVRVPWVVSSVHIHPLPPLGAVVHAYSWLSAAHEEM